MGGLDEDVSVVLWSVMGPLCLAVVVFASVGYLFQGQTICELHAGWKRARPKREK